MNNKIILFLTTSCLMSVVFFLGCIEEGEEIESEKIIIDGNNSEWFRLGIQPILISPNDPNISDEVEIKAICLATDGEKIYAIMELYDQINPDKYIYGMSLSPNRTYFGFDKTGLSVKIEDGDCGLSTWIHGQDINKFGGEISDPEFNFNSSCAINGNIIEFVIEGITPIYIYSNIGSNDDNPITPYTMMEKVIDFHSYGLKLVCSTYDSTDKKSIDRIEKSSPKVTDIITRI